MPKLNKYFSWLFAVCSLFFCIQFAAIDYNAYGRIQFSDMDAENCELLTDGQSGFYLLDVNGKDIKAKYITEGGSAYSAAFSLTAPCLSYCVYNGVLYCVSRESVNALDSQLFVATYRFNDGSMDINAINGVSVQNRGDFATDGQRLYFVNAAQKSEVCAYSLQGKQLYTLSCEFPVQQLSVDKNTLLAFTSSGLFFAAAGEQTFSYCRGALPRGRILPLSHGYLADTGGNVYAYTKNTLKLVFSVSFSGSGINGAYLEDTFYFANGRTVDGYNKDGERIRTAVFGTEFAFLTISSGKIGAFSAQDSMFYLLTAQDIPKIPLPKPTQPQSGSQGGQSGSNSQTSRPGETYGQISSKTYRLDRQNKLITGISSGTTVAVLKKNISYKGYTLLVKKQDGSIKTTGALGTGMTITFLYPGGSIKEEYKVVIYGDITGEGNCNSRDIRLFMSVLLGEETLAFPYNFAADLNQDGMIDATDLLKEGKLCK